MRGFQGLVDRTMKSILVSVTVITHNSGRFIDRCLDAVFRQEHKPLEVIVVDNASQDESRHVLALCKDRIRLIEMTTTRDLRPARTRPSPPASASGFLR